MYQKNAQFYDLAAGVMNVLVLAALLAAINQLNARMTQQESRVQALTTEDQSLTSRRASSTSLSPPRPASLVDTRLLGKLQGFNGDVQKRLLDWGAWVKAYLGASEVRHQSGSGSRSPQIREEILEATRTQHCMNNQRVPMHLRTSQTSTLPRAEGQDGLTIFLQYRERQERQGRTRRATSPRRLEMATRTGCATTARRSGTRR